MNSSRFVFFIAFIFTINFSQSQNSVLSEGSWYKIAVEQTGIHQIGYDDLLSYGLNPDQINPKHVQLFGNGNGMLPEPNSAFRYNDLMENAIFVNGEDDESFDPGDYILFYGEGPTKWELNTVDGHLNHKTNYYSDLTYYFLTINSEQGKRIEYEIVPDEDPNQFINKFTGYYAHETDELNLLKSGKTWYGEEFEDNTSHCFLLNLEGIDIGFPISIKTIIAARSIENSTMEMTQNEIPITNFVFNSINPNGTKYAQEKISMATFHTNSEEVNICFTYNQIADSSFAWLDYFELNYLLSLEFYYSNQFAFRSLLSVFPGNISQFTISNSDISTKVWNVTDPINISGIEGIAQGSDYEFKIATDSLLEFITFKGNEFSNPEFIGQIENQNLHGHDPVDFIIVTPPEFMVAAEQLGQFHESNDGLSWLAVTPDQIYNEFSSGTSDITAIRDFVRYMYLQSEEQSPRYLLLFGDGSYDPKDRIEYNVNFVPTFQTKESLTASSSYVIDDYFGFLDENEGNDAIGNLDIGIGRIPVKTNSEATEAVSKIIHYATNTDTFGDWKNDICFVADDGDGNLHLEMADSLVNFSTNYNIDKLYFDFFELVQTSEGYRYPDAKAALNQKIENGVLFINYTGHGSFEGWASEKVLEIEDIQSWNNTNKLPVMVAASCEFTRFDDPAFVSGGELTVLKNQGGVIGLFGCSRLAYAQSNFTVNQRITSYFSNPEINTKRLGDLIRYSKPMGQLTTRNIVLIGDPALKISIPDLFVITETINGVNVNQPHDTIHPGDEITITGIVNDFEGNLMNDFSGNLLVKVYDRAYIKTTLGNQPFSNPVDIMIQDSILIEFQSEVQDGEFEFSFTLPNAMTEDFGKIKLSYYAFDETIDASGNYSELIFGGEPNSIQTTNQNHDFSLYPTNASTQLNLINRGNVADIQTDIFDVSGRILLSENYKSVQNNSIVKLNISALPEGFYVLKVISARGISDFKFIKK